MDTNWTQIYTDILQLEAQGLVTRTFRRLDPERQQAILLAILEEAAEAGPTDLNIKRVAERAEVSVGSLYQYFGNRHGLLVFATTLAVNQVVGQFSLYRSILAEMPLRQALEAYLAGGVEWSQTQAGFVRFFVRAAYGGDPEWAEQVVRPVADVMRLMVLDILTAAQQRGELRPGIDLEATARIVHALTIAAGDPLLFPQLNVYFQIIGDDVTPERMLAALLDLVEGGIGAPKEHAQ